jgi:pyruvate,water dikinase
MVVDSAGIVGSFRKKYIHFKILLDSNAQLLNILSDIEEKLKGKTVFGLVWLRSQCIKITFHTGRMIRSFEILSGRKYPELYQTLDAITRELDIAEASASLPVCEEDILFYSQIDSGKYGCVGGKSAHLAEIRNHVGLVIPRGFAITTAVFRKWVESDTLYPFIRKEKEKLDVIQPETVMDVSRAIQEVLERTEIPSEIAKNLLAAFDRLSQDVGVDRERMRVAMRSSALGEDTEMSFAGQYLSVLNVTRDRLLAEYKNVVASLFSENAISYRQHMGIPFQDTAMSVACLEMISSAISGVMYTRHPFDASSNQIIVHALWGLGPYVVDGRIEPDMFRVEREPALWLKERKIADKAVKLIADESGNLVEEAVADELRKKACLNEDQVLKLAEYGMKLEVHFGCPQDVEWAIDPDGRIVILQSRPLKIEAQAGKGTPKDNPLSDGYDVLIEGAEIANPGIGIGKAVIVRSLSDLADFPEGAILVVPNSSPQYVLVLPKVQGVIADAGSMTGHMAAICREYRVPTLMNARGATQTIQQGEMVTVDALRGRVYRGEVKELAVYREDCGAFMKSSPVYEMLNSRARFIIPLNLVDPKSDQFTASNCRTIHDIMRYLHELSYGEIFHLSDQASDKWNVALKLVSGIPLDLYIVDLGGGVSQNRSSSSRVKVDEITSVPFRALLSGMSRHEFHMAEPRPIELSGFFSVMSRQLLDPPNMATERFGDKSYAIISNKYLNFSSRVGYHYSILDAYCGKTAAKNYVHFQFKGGAADVLRRERRARCIAVILEQYGFLCEVVGDRVNARYAKNISAHIVERLDILGRLLMYTRQMDMLMKSDEAIQVLARQFIEGNYALSSDHMDGVKT